MPSAYRPKRPAQYRASSDRAPATKKRKPAILSLPRERGTLFGDTDRAIHPFVPGSQNNAASGDSIDHKGGEQQARQDGRRNVTRRAGNVARHAQDNAVTNRVHLEGHGESPPPLPGNDGIEAPPATLVLARDSRNVCGILQNFHEKLRNFHKILRNFYKILPEEHGRI